MQPRRHFLMSAFAAFALTIPCAYASDLRQTTPYHAKKIKKYKAPKIKRYKAPKINRKSNRIR